jgi:hypothetical protein
MNERSRWLHADVFPRSGEIADAVEVRCRKRAKTRAAALAATSDFIHYVMGAALTEMLPGRRDALRTWTDLLPALRDGLLVTLLVIPCPRDGPLLRGVTVSSDAALFYPCRSGRHAGRGDLIRSPAEPRALSTWACPGLAGLIGAAAYRLPAAGQRACRKCGSRQASAVADPPRRAAGLVVDSLT